MKVIIIHFRHSEIKHLHDVEIHGEDREAFYIGDNKYYKNMIIKLEVFP